MIGNMLTLLWYGSASITASCADSASGAIAAKAGMFGRKSTNETLD